MDQKKLARWLKIITFFVAIAGVLVYAVVIPDVGDAIICANGEEYRSWCMPWIVFLWVTAVPCYIMLYYFWKVCSEIENDRSFNIVNAVYLKRISQWSLIDVIYFFIGNIVMLFINMNHPGVVLLSFLVDFAGIAISVAAATLSHLVYKAAELESENKFTI